ncbi:hypothetical protein N431DRAFT_469148 [Stipitochalara longipes BDJ]|nr:hypothetical protein N431DRAFT_469148 [Stipitochalara longipes BDJ]
MRQEDFQELASGKWTMVPPSDTGDAIRGGQTLDAATAHMDDACNTSATRHCQPPRLVGHRFSISQKVLILWEIAPSKPPKRTFTNGLFKKATSLNKLTNEIDVDTEGLISAVSHFNVIVVRGINDDFEKENQSMIKTMEIEP